MLKELSKKLILNQIFRHSSSSKSWRVLIVDETTTPILESIFSSTEIFTYEILKIYWIKDAQRIRLPDNPAIYFIEPTDENIKILLNDRKSMLYSRYTLINITEMSERNLKKIEAVKEPEISIKFFPMNYLCFDKNIFLCKKEHIKDVSMTLERNFIYTCLKNRNLKIIEDLKVRTSDLKYERTCNFLFYDRFSDIFTPLSRFYTFQALLNDFGFFKNNFFIEKSINYENDQLWNKIKNLHIGEINAILTNTATELNKNMKNIQKAETADLLKAVLDAPNQIKLKENLSIFLGLLDRTITKFEKHCMNHVSLIEQNLCTRKDLNKNTYSFNFGHVFDLFNNSEITLLDKIRLFYLVYSNGYSFTSTEIKKLKDVGIIQSIDIKTAEKLKNIKDEHIFVKQKEYKFDLSRYTPLLQHAISSFESKRKEFKYVTLNSGSFQQVTSLRKSNFIFQGENRKNQRKTMVVYIEGGITFAEIRIADILADTMGMEIILGSDKILDYEGFIEDLNKL